MRSCGYKHITDKNTGKESFVKKLSAQGYPRFHAYLVQNAKEVTVDLHLDQTKTLYSGQTAHRADYESKEVQNELLNIFNIFKKTIK